MNRKYTFVSAGRMAATGCGAAPRPRSSPAAAHACTPDVKIETVERRAGHLHARGPRRQHRPHGWRRRRCDHRRPVRRHGSKIRAAVAMLGQAGELRDRHAPARRSHRWQRRVRQAGAVIIAHENVRKRLGCAGESLDQPAHPGACARSAARRHVREFGDAAFQRRRSRVHAIAECAHRDGHRHPLPKANVLHMGDCFAGGFPFIDGNTGGTLDG